jgi:hypothetical protein
METATYTICPAPKFAAMIEWTCPCCGYENLKSPVFLKGNGVVAGYGSGCAAVLLYGRKDAKTVRLTKNAFDAANHAEAQRIERIEELKHNYSIALESLNNDKDNCPYLQGARKFWHGRGLGFVAFVKDVAANGNLADY